MTRILSAALTLFVVAPAVAQTPPAEKLPDGAKVVRLAVTPAAVKLTGPFAYTQLLVTAHLDGGITADVTRIAKLTAPPLVAVSPAGLVRPAADGSGDITVSLGG